MLEGTWQDCELHSTRSKQRWAQVSDSSSSKTQYALVSQGWSHHRPHPDALWCPAQLTMANQGDAYSWVSRAGCSTVEMASCWSVAASHSMIACPPVLTACAFALPLRKPSRLRLPESEVPQYCRAPAKAVAAREATHCLCPEAGAQRHGQALPTPCRDAAPARRRRRRRCGSEGVGRERTGASCRTPFRSRQTACGACGGAGESPPCVLPELGAKWKSRGKLICRSRLHTPQLGLSLWQHEAIATAAPPQARV